MAMKSAHKKAVANKLAKELGDFVEASRYFYANQDFEPTIEDAEPTVCLACGEEYKRGAVYSCNACGKNFAPKGGLVKASLDVEDKLCPNCGEKLGTKSVIKCACGIKEVGADEMRMEAAKRLAAYLGRYGKLTKKASRLVKQAMVDDDTVAWGDCITDQYAEGYSLGEAVAICNCIKREVLATLSGEAKKDEEELAGVIEVVFDGEQFYPLNSDAEGTIMRIEYVFDPSKPSNEALTLRVIENEEEEEGEEGEEEESVACVDNTVVAEDDNDDEDGNIEDEVEWDFGMDLKEHNLNGVVDDFTEEFDEDEFLELLNDEDAGNDDEEGECEGIDEDEGEDEGEIDIPPFDESMLKGTNLDVPEEERVSMTEDELVEARKKRIAQLVKRMQTRKASLEVVEPSDKKPLGDDTSHDPQAGTKGEPPKVDSQSGTHMPEPKKEIVEFEGENPLEYQNELVEADKPKIPTQRELELQRTAVPQKEAIKFEGEEPKGQMDGTDQSYNLKAPEVPVSGTTPHDNEAYRKEDLRRPIIPSQTEEGRYEMEFVAEEDKRLEALRSYASRVKKASRIANELVNLGIIDNNEYDNKVEQLASLSDGALDGYMDDIRRIHERHSADGNTKEGAIKRVGNEVVAAQEGATSVVFVPNEQAVNVADTTDAVNDIASIFSVGGGGAQKSISVSEFKQFLNEE